MLFAVIYDKDGNIIEQKPLPFRGEEDFYKSSEEKDKDLEEEKVG